MARIAPISQQTFISPFAVLSETKFSASIVWRSVYSTTLRIATGTDDHFIEFVWFKLRLYGYLWTGKFNWFNINWARTDASFNYYLYFQKETAGYWRLHSLRGNIKICLNMKDSETVLKFHDLITREMCRRTLNNNPQIETSEMRFKNVMGLDWSCTPRPKPLAINDSTHDLPNFNDFSCKFSILEQSFHPITGCDKFIICSTFQLSTISSIGRKKAELLRRLIVI